MPKRIGSFSGRGKLPKRELDAPISAHDHPFLRTHAPALVAQTEPKQLRNDGLGLSYNSNAAKKSLEAASNRNRSKSESSQSRRPMRK